MPPISTFRVFLSSPGDVKDEREAAERVVRRIGGIYAAHVEVVLARWEGKFYQATAGFQEQIEATAAFDLVIGILWKRIGTELPPDLFCRPDGSPFESGTVLELESALEASTTHGGTPAVFVFRKEAEILFSKQNLADETAQNELLDAWWNRTFRDAKGRFRRAAEGFKNTTEFETRFEDLLVHELCRKGLVPEGAIWDVKVKGSPFPGLEPYGKERRSVLFGRSLAVRDACDELIKASHAKEGLPALFVIGPSGSGKSSLVRAGIAPELTNPGVVPDVDCWRSITVEGDTALLRALATQLYRQDGLPELAESPRKIPASWAQLSAEAPTAAAEDIVWALDRVASAEQLRTGADRTLQTRLLLVVDQLERMFGADDAAKVPALLRALSGTGRVWLIATLRSDRYAALQSDRDLLELRRRGTIYDLPSPGQAEITDIVKGPTRAAGLTFEDGERDGKTLARVLVENTPGADALPLLQMTLRQLFDEQRDMTLTWKAYDAIGGVSGAIATHAERVLADLLPAVRNELPDLVSKLARDVAREASGRIRFTTTAADAGWATTPTRQALVDRMVEKRLLVEDEPEPGRKVLRVAHEALLRQWGPAKSALEAIADRALRRARLLQIGAFASAGVFLLVAAAAGWFYWRAKDATRFSQLIYTSEIALTQQALETHNIQRARDLLDEQARNPSVKARDRFEWKLFWHLCHRELVTFEPQPAWKELNETEPQAIWIKAIAVSGDGKTLAAAAWDRKVTFWDLDQKKQIGSLFAHDREVSAMTLSEDGNTLATGNNRGEIKFWNRKADSWASVNLPKQAGAINCLRFSPQSALFASACNDHFTKLWDANSGEPREVKSFRSSTSVNAVAFSGDGGKLAFAGEDRIVHLCDVASLEELPTQLSCRSSVNSLSFSRDGAIIVAGCEDGTITLWNLETNHSSTHPGHLAAVLSVTLSNDGKLLVTGSEDNSIKLWPINNTDELDDLGVVTLLGHTDYVNQVALTPKCELLISASNDGLIKLWDGRIFPEVLEFAAHTPPITSVAFSPSSTLAAADDGDGSVAIRKRPTYEVDTSVPEIGASAIVFISDNIIAVGRNDGGVNIWRIRPLERLCAFDGGDGGIVSLAYAPERQLLAAGTDQVNGQQGCMVKVWDVAAQKLVAVMRAHDRSVRFVCFAPNGNVLASGSWDHKVNFWNTRKLIHPLDDSSPSFESLWIFKGDEGFAGPATFSKDSRTLICGTWSKSILFIDVAGHHESRVGGNKSVVCCSALSPDGNTLATGSLNDRITLWDLNNKRQLATLPTTLRYTWSVEFSPDGLSLASGGDDGILRLYDCGGTSQ